MVMSKVAEAAASFQAKHPFLVLFVLAVGSLKLFNLMDSLVNLFIDTVMPRKPDLSAYKTRKTASAPRNWAIVTGSTAGIGEEYALQLAAAGLNVALVSRNATKLDAVAANIVGKYKVETRSFVIDALTARTDDYTQFSEFVASLGPVSVLINNVGVSHEMPVPFSEMSDNELHGIIQVNCVSTLEITRAVLPFLTKHAQSDKNARSLVLTMGSFAGLTPTPLLSVYSGSKAFLQAWSSALAAELEPSKVDVRLVISYLVTSGMSKIRRTSLLVTNPKEFVASTLRQTRVKGGAQERAYTVTPYWSHALMHWGIENALGVFNKLVAKINYNMHLDIRKRALRKKAKTN